jgi:hypothetical protein
LSERDAATAWLGALDLSLSSADLAALNEAIPAGTAAGARYDASQMAHLDSEKKSSHDSKRRQ